MVNEGVVLRVGFVFGWMRLEAWIITTINERRDIRQRKDTVLLHQHHLI
jgi:hypothetical protein